jgi:hypothetical protein
MRRLRSAKFVAILFCLFSACASFEPGMRYQDLMRPRQPTAEQSIAGFSVSVEEFASERKSRQAFDADVAPHGLLALLLKVENNGSQTVRVQENMVSAYLGNELLGSLGGENAAGQSANSEYAGKALGWTLAAGPFAILLWPVTIGASAAHTASVNRRIEQHFESLRFNDALLKPNQTAAGFLYYKLPDQAKRLESLRLEIVTSIEGSGEKPKFVIPLPVIDLSAPVSARVAEPIATNPAASPSQSTSNTACVSPSSC